MCEQCKNIVERFYPHLKEEDQAELLMSATAFPFGGPETIERQLRELRRRTDGSLMAAIAFADRSMWKTMEWLRTKDNA